ncbi:HPr kinase/phosphorylase [Methylobacterium sp. sgz302541]|uniref:HPr kinase/phosphorylase n=1 Tax=unclassified Methylobacterium TaxID=2615210 RepID=UPI003D34BCBB
MTSLHATCVVLGGAGVLIRGESGAGKSVLALQLIDRAREDGAAAALVGDDRIRLEAVAGRLVARGHPAVAGLIEMRGIGLCRIASADSAPVRLVVDLVPTAPRMPEPADAYAVFCGIAIPRLAIERGLRDAGLAPLAVRSALSSAHGVASQSHSPGLGAVVDHGP